MTQMDQVVLTLKDKSFSRKDNVHVADLEEKLNIESDFQFNILTELEIFYFKQGVKAGIEFSNFLNSSKEIY